MSDELSGPRENPEPTDTDTAARPANRSADRLLRVAYVLVPAVFAAVTVVLIVAAWPTWWVYIAPEQSPMTWLQSVLLVLCGLLAAMPAAQEWLRGRGLRELLPFLLLAAGFAWLALDERFTIHERLRDNVLAPRHVRVPLLPWVGPGDFLLLGYAIAGLLVLRLVLRGLREDRRARRLFLAGVACALAVVAVDSVDPDRMSQSVERIEQTLEELVELAGGALFLLALLTHYLHLVERHATTAPGVTGATHGRDRSASEGTLGAPLGGE